MKKKLSYRDLQRENERLRSEYKPAMNAFRNSAEKVLNEAAGEAAHAILGQSILEQIIKDVAYKKITAGEAKLWLETKWHKRHEVDGTYEEQCEFLGIDPIDMKEAFKEIDAFVTKSVSDRAIQLFMSEFNQ